MMGNIAPIVADIGVQVKAVYYINISDHISFQLWALLQCSVSSRYSIQSFWTIQVAPQIVNVVCDQN